MEYPITTKVERLLAMLYPEDAEVGEAEEATFEWVRDQLVELIEKGPLVEKARASLLTVLLPGSSSYDDDIKF